MTHMTTTAHKINSPLNILVHPGQSPCRWGIHDVWNNKCDWETDIPQICAQKSPNSVQKNPHLKIYVKEAKSNASVIALEVPA